MNSTLSLSDCCKLAALAYQPIDKAYDSLTTMGFHNIQRIYEPSTDTCFLQAINEDGILIRVWQGTRTLLDLEIDAKARMRKWRGYNIHDGFLEGYQSVNTVPIPPGVRIAYFDGHSLGGAYATLDAMACSDNLGYNNVFVRTFGSPRVGDAAFAHEFNKRFKNSIRVVHSTDLVPRIPAPPCYRHVNDLLHLCDDGSILSTGKSFFTRLAMMDIQGIADLDGAALECHHIASYQRAIDSMVG